MSSHSRETRRTCEDSSTTWNPSSTTTGVPFDETWIRFDSSYPFSKDQLRAGMRGYIHTSTAMRLYERGFLSTRIPHTASGPASSILYEPALVSCLAETFTLSNGRG